MLFILTALLLVLTSCINVLVSFQVLHQVQNTIYPIRVAHTYVEDDFPLRAPMKEPLPFVAMAFDDADYYAMDNITEWRSIVPDGEGFVHFPQLSSGGDKLGQERIFGIMMFHEFHCLEMIRRAIIHKDVTGHAHHCFNFLRQSIICDADTTLEPELEPGIGGGVGVVHICRDWSGVYNYAEQNLQDFHERRHDRGYTN